MADIQNAINDLRIILGADRILAQPDQIKNYKIDTSGTVRDIPAAVRPRSVDDIIKIVKIAGEHSLPLYPVSKGNNWGYGSANPAKDGCVILDMSEMTQIKDYDPDIGIVTVEPGVTQQKLWEYLRDQGNRHITPTTGAGPEASILGNALERGYGITPMTDHFGALLSLEAVLPDGSVYHSPIFENGSPEVDRVFKWGFGPYMDGLFSQGNFGIVTKATIQLAPRPEKLGAFIFEMRKDADLEKAVTLVHETLSGMHGIVGSINLMNSLRLLSMSAPYPFDLIKKSPDTYVSQLEHMALEMDFAPWTCLGSFYGKKEIVRTANQLLKERVYPHTKRLIFLSRSQLNIAERILKMLPSWLSKNLLTRVEKMKMSFDILEGIPSYVAMPLCYRKLAEGMPDNASNNPAKDGCGIMWYAPLVPMKPGIVRDFVNFIHRTCVKHQIEPLITLTSVSDRCFDSTIPIVYDPKNPEDMARAHNCYNELLKEGMALGFHPYRTGVDQMNLFIDPSKPFWAMQKTLKEALDPKGIIAPGRYSA